MNAKYSGVDILEALESAHHYNDYLTGLVRDAANAREIIDYGAGLGTFSKRLRDADYQVICIEPDPSQREKLVQQGFQAFHSIEALPDNSASFIFSLNVLEHIKDDAAALKDIHRKLRPGGKALIYVPAFHCLWTGLDDKVCHYRRYTRGTLQSVIQEVGFSIEKLRYADCLGFVAALVFRLFRRNAETLNSASISFYDRWVFPLGRALDTVFHPFFGKNVYVLCRK